MREQDYQRNSTLSQRGGKEDRLKVLATTYTVLFFPLNMSCFLLFSCLKTTNTLSLGVFWLFILVVLMQFFVSSLLIPYTFTRCELRKKEGSRLTNISEPVGRLSSRSFRVLLAGLSAFLSSTRGKIFPFQA